MLQLDINSKKVIVFFFRSRLIFEAVFFMYIYQLLKNKKIMYTSIQFVHSYWAYLTLFTVLIAVINAIAGWFGKKEFQPKDFRISLFALIFTHIQVVIGLILLFLSPKGISAITDIGMGAVMKDTNLRLFIVEHPLILIISVILITIGYSKQKKKLMSAKKFKTIAIYYTLALMIALSRIPWSQWFDA